MSLTLTQSTNNAAPVEQSRAPLRVVRAHRRARRPVLRSVEERDNRPREISAVDVGTGWRQQAKQTPFAEARAWIDQCHDGWDRSDRGDWMEKTVKAHEYVTTELIKWERRLRLRRKAESIETAKHWVDYYRERLGETSKKMHTSLSDVPAKACAQHAMVTAATFS